MSIYQLKPKFQALLRPLTGALHKAGATANQVTVAACVVSILLGLFLIFEIERKALFLLIPLWLLIRMAFNAIDGMLAREFGQASPLGAYLNELTDVISDAALYAPFALLPGSNPWLVGIVILLAALSEMTGVMGAAAGGGRRYDGPMGKSDRAAVFGILGLLAGLAVPMQDVMNWIWVVVIVLTAVTIANRVRKGIAA